MRKHILLPAFTGVFGVLGLILRQLQLRAGYDAAGLPTDSLIHLAVPLCAAVFLLGVSLAIFALRGNVPALDYDRAFACKDNAGQMTAAVCSAAFLLCGTVLTVLDFLRGDLPNSLHLLLGLFLGAGGCGLVLLEKNNYRAMGQGRNSGKLLLAAYAAAFWLILTYQGCSGTPILQSYLYRLLAVVFVLLGFYFMAGFSFEKGRPLLTLWSGLCASYFSCVALLDDLTWRNTAFLAGFLIYFITHSAVLLQNLTVEREEATDE